MATNGLSPVEASKEYKDAIRALDRNKVLANKGIKVNTAQIKINGLLVKYYSSTYNLVKRMVVKPEWIKLYYKISDGEPFDLSLWEELTQAEKNFLFQIISKCYARKENVWREMGERQRKEAKPIFNRLYVNENQIRIGNDSEEVFKAIEESLKELIDRHLIDKNISTRLIKQYKLLSSA